MSLWSRNSLGRGQRVVVSIGLVIAQSVVSTIACAETIIVPSVTAAESYDSNVFFAPRSLLAPGSRPHDFITRVTPQIAMAHANSLMRGNLSVGGLITRYVHNPRLDYTGINAAGGLDITNVANQYSRRITALNIRGTYQFTPETSGFLAAGGTQQAGAGTPLGGAVAGGLLTNRVSTHRYNLGLTGGYELTPTMGLTGAYNYSRMTFGNQSGGVKNFLFDTSAHQGVVTITTSPSPRDMVGVAATVNYYAQSQRGQFLTTSPAFVWNREWTRELRSTLSVGGILSFSPPGSVVVYPTQFAPTTTASIVYSSYSEGLRAAGASLGPFAGGASQGPFDGLPPMPGSLAPGGIMTPGEFTAALRYTYSVFPSYSFAAGPVKAHVLSANVTGGIAGNLTANAGMNISHGNRDFPDTSYSNIGAVAGLGYLIGPVLVTVTGNWMAFTNSSSTSAIGSREYLFSKESVMVSLSYAFTSSNQSFFRMDGFGSGGKQGGTEGGSVPPGSGAGSRSSGDGSQY